MEITNMVSTTTAFGLCRCKCGIYALVGDPSTVPPTQISCNMVFSKSKNEHDAATFCTIHQYAGLLGQMTGTQPSNVPSIILFL